jgi:predicted adenylyl cyclase CyaB
MAVNFELKARVSSLAKARAQAQELGAAFQGILRQEDIYFRVPRGRLKLRLIDGVGAELIFYERHEVELERWSHFTREPVEDGGALKQMLTEALGVLAVVRKERWLYQYDLARIHIDEVEGIGEFIEFEVMTTDQQKASTLMHSLRQFFHVRDEEIFKGSYSDMVLKEKNFG